MGSANTPCVIERVFSLTRWTVAGEMEFGYEIRELDVHGIKIGVVVRNPLEVVNRPLASDVV